MTLTAGRDPIAGIRNVSYRYSGQDSLELNGSEYPPRAPIEGSINDDNKLVLTGSGFELRRVSFRSPSRSIVPSDSPTPFTSFIWNQSNSVDTSSSSFVTLDGDLTLTAGYNPRVGGKDVAVFIQEVGDRFLPFSKRVSTYPDTLPPLQVSLNQDNRFVLTETGEELLGSEFESESGSLVPGDTNELFQITLQNTPNKLTYGVLGLTTS